MYRIPAWVVEEEKREIRYRRACKILALMLIALILFIIVPSDIKIKIPTLYGGEYEQTPVSTQGSEEGNASIEIVDVRFEVEVEDLHKVVIEKAYLTITNNGDRTFDEYVYLCFSIPSKNVTYKEDAQITLEPNETDTIEEYLWSFSFERNPLELEYNVSISIVDYYNSNVVYATLNATFSLARNYLPYSLIYEEFRYTIEKPIITDINESHVSVIFNITITNVGRTSDKPVHEIIVYVMSEKGYYTYEYEYIDVELLPEKSISVTVNVTVPKYWGSIVEAQLVLSEYFEEYYSPILLMS